MPGYVEAYHCIGNDLFIKGMPDEAIRTYFGVLKHSSDCPAAYISIGMAMQRKGALDESATAFRDAISSSTATGGHITSMA